MGARPLLGGVRVTAARSLTELDCVVPAWEALARSALEPNPFYEHWMLRPAIAAFGGGKVEVVLVWAGEELAGLFPFVRQPRYKGMPASALASWQHPHTLLCTPLVHAGYARPCLEALFDALDAALVEFRYIPAGEPFHRLLAEARPESVVNHAYSRALLRKNGATISGNFRRKAAKAERRLKGFACRFLGAGDDIGAWIDEFLRVEAGSWKGRNGSAMASNQANRGYFTEIVTAAFRRGQLLGCGIDAEGRAIARRFSFTAGAAAYAFKTAYDEAFADFSPGALLELANVRQVDADPAVQWMDSFTEKNVLAVERLWPDRREMQTVVAGVGAWGRLAAAALPWLRWIKRRIP
jgi:CelD/BcsL family acetyltransferase involved in cellulose biosynthesis